MARSEPVLLLGSFRQRATCRHSRAERPQTYNNVLHVYGLHWAMEHHSLAERTQTYNNVLHVYGLHWAKEHALPLGGALEGSAAALRRCDLYLQHSVALEQARPEALGPTPWTTEWFRLLLSAAFAAWGTQAAPASLHACAWLSAVPGRPFANGVVLCAAARKRPSERWFFCSATCARRARARARIAATNGSPASARTQKKNERRC